MDVPPTRVWEVNIKELERKKTKEKQKNERKKLK